MPTPLLKSPPASRPRKIAIGAFGLSTLVHIALFMIIGGVVLVDGIIPKSPFVGELEPTVVSESTPLEDEPEQDQPMPESPSEETAISAPAPQVAVESQIFVESPSPNFSIPTPVAGTVTGLAMGTGAAPNAQGTAGPGPKTNHAATIFGTLGESENGLIGRFYDLKQDASGKAVAVDYAAVVSDFMKQGWSTDVLAHYYRAKQSMTATQFYIPAMDASIAPALFGVEKEVRPSQWIIHYKGKITSPKTGFYRFVGIGDDLLVVRFDGKEVLNASLIDFPGIPREPLGASNFAGSWIMLHSRQTYSIEVLVGERPGGFFSGILMLEEKGEKIEWDKDLPVLPLFQTTATDIPRTTANARPVAKKSFVCLPNPDSP